MGFVGYSVALFAGGVQLASVSHTTQPAINGTFVPVKLTFDSGPFTGQGQPLEIRLSSLGWQASFDNVRLSAVPHNSVPIVNPSFEETPLADATWTTGTIPGWTKSGPEIGYTGVANMNTSHYAIQQATDGQNVAIVGNATLSQVLQRNVEPNTRYTLEVDVGDRLDMGFVGYSVGLFAGGTQLASIGNVTQPAINGTFIPVRLVYDSLSFAGQGQPLEIRLISTGWQASFDNVRLSATPGWTKSGTEIGYTGVANMSTGQYSTQQATRAFRATLFAGSCAAKRIRFKNVCLTRMS
jgi:hypothetical protein